jgi:hypothetical protein
MAMARRGLARGAEAEKRRARPLPLAAIGGIVRAFDCRGGESMIRLTSALALALLVTGTTPGAAQSTPPSPVLYMTGMEAYEANGKSWIRYRFDVHNKEAFPDELFAAAPGLPPCGNNANAARSWVDFYEASGRRIYGFCSLSKASDLGSIWFAAEEGTVPPSYVYIEINDRQTGIRYRSNLTDTVL